MANFGSFVGTCLLYFNHLPTHVKAWPLCMWFLHLCQYLLISYSIPRMHPSQIFNPASIFSLITLHAFRDISFQFEYACMPAYACNPPEGTRIPKCTPDASCRLWRLRTYINSRWSLDYIRFTKIWCQHRPPSFEVWRVHASKLCKSNASICLITKWTWDFGFCGTALS